jgi:hypothetical protein
MAGQGIVATSLIDCDIHNAVPAVEALFPYLGAHWQEYIRESSFKGPVDGAYPKHAPTSVRPGATDDGPPGAGLAALCRETLDAWRAEFGILSSDYAVTTVHNPDCAAALASAYNDWLIEEWLDKEPRLRASLVVPSQSTELAVREIARVGNHPGFVQVFLPVRSDAPYGNRRYWPIYAAAVQHGLVVSVHYGGAPGHPPSPTGWPSRFIEEYVDMAQVFQSQVISLVCEGVFNQFPTLRVALVEGGFTWLPSLMWRLDKDWKAIRREVPWLRRAPSEYIREHMRLTIQPLDAPRDPGMLLQIIEQLESGDLLLFATDYPHWHFNHPAAALPEGLSGELRQKILADNARYFYRL